MAGVQTGHVIESPDVVQNVSFRISNTTLANCIALASGANGITALPLGVPKGAVVIGAWFHPIVKAGSTVTFSLGKSGTFVRGGSGQLGTFGSAILPSGALSAANRVSTAVNLGGSAFTAGSMTEIPIHTLATATVIGALNNNQLEPGAQLFAYTLEDVAAITFNGILTVRYRETIA